MSDPVSATLTHALDQMAEAPALLDFDELGEALSTTSARRAALEREGIRVNESPYLHFLRRFTAETVPPVLAASA